jgi:hypothetical protein
MKKLLKRLFFKPPEGHVEVALQINGKYAGYATIKIDTMEKLMYHQHRSVSVPGKLINFVVK